MASLLQAAAPKSDQLNFVDLGAGGERQIYVESVITDLNLTQQKTSVFYTGCNGKPWKPSVGMLRVLAAAYGDNDQNTVGKTLLLWGDGTVKFGPEQTGGIRIKALSDINKSGIDVYVAENRKKRRKQHFAYLDVAPVTEQITEIDRSWIDAVKANPEVLATIEDVNYRARIERLAV